MSNFTYTVTWNGSPPHDYYIYEPSREDKTGANYDFHVTVPLTDKVMGRYGTYPHITLIAVRNKKKKWRDFSESVHWYIYTSEKDAPVAVHANGTPVNLDAPQRLLLEKLYADMKEYKVFPWVSNAAKKSK